MAKVFTWSDWCSSTEKSSFREFYKSKYPVYPLNVLIFLEVIEAPSSDAHVSDTCIQAFESVVQSRYTGCPNEIRNFGIFQSVFRDGKTFTEAGKIHGVSTERVRQYIRAFCRSLKRAFANGSASKGFGTFVILFAELGKMNCISIAPVSRSYTISDNFEYLGYDIPYIIQRKGIGAPFSHCKQFKYPFNLLTRLGALPAEGRYASLSESAIADFEAVLLKYLGSTADRRHLLLKILQMYYRDGAGIADINKTLEISNASARKSEAHRLLSALLMRKARAGITDPEARQLLLFYKPKKGVD